MSARRRLLVLQHARSEHPGVFRRFFEEDGIAWDAVELDEGEALPSLDGYDGMWVMGGPMDVWEEAEHPWLRAEQECIREAVVERHMPFLGFCLGHQLLAAALGGQVGPAGTPEVGVMTVQWQDTEPQGRGVFTHLSPSPAVLQWHSAEVTRAPPTARVLASSPACAIQAIQVGPRAFGLQFHLEVDEEMLHEWGRIPAYRKALDKTFGEDGFGHLEAQLLPRISEIHGSARQLYRSWSELLRDDKGQGG